MALIEPTDCPYFLVSRATLAITTALKQALQKAGADKVRPAYLGVLMSLWFEDGVKAIDLCRRAGLEPSSMTGLLDRMERDGLVRRMADPGDRRAQRIHLTDEGRRMRRPVERVVNQTLDKALAGVDEEELGRVKTVLRRVLANANRLGLS